MHRPTSSLPPTYVSLVCLIKDWA